MGRIKFWDIVFLLPLTVGVLFILQSVNEKRRITKIENNGTHVKGIVTKVALKGDTDKDWTEYEIEYSDNSGNSYTVSNRLATNDMRYHVGDSVKVVYERTNPQQAFIDSRIERNAFIVGLIAGFACLCLTAFFQFYLRHKFFPSVPVEVDEK